MRIGNRQFGKSRTQHGLRTELAAQIAAGKDRQGVIDYFVTKYGSQEVLAEPIDKGFNRLAWLLPYATGVLGVAAIGGVAWRWSRRGAQAADETAAPASAEMEARLDDELRDLD